MLIHIHMAWFCLTVLWSQKKISYLDRFRLWRKSINLYMCLSGFTDNERPANQLRSTMVCAFLSAIYDYETDWRPIPSANDSAFLQLLNRYVENCVVKQMASKLFLTDLDGKLSKDGLERGSGAFRFYRSVIGSNWLAQYPKEDLDEFGRLLQQVDDLLDLNSDRRNGHANCFLTDERSRYLTEAEKFLSGNFFQLLISHASIYALIGWRCKYVCQSLAGTLPSWRQLIGTFRPLTIIYAGIAVLAGFKLTTGLNLLAIIMAVTFSLVTGSIMAFNDFMEREHDRKRGKNFANDYTWSLLRGIAVCFVIISILLIATAYMDFGVSLFAFTVWFIGLFYSLPFVRRWYIIQAVIVALSSAAPILCGAIHGRGLSLPILLIFFSLVLIVLVREFVGDMKDISSDRGYKKTIPTQNGVGVTVWAILLVLNFTALLLVLTPIMSIRVTAFGLALVQAFAGLTLIRPERRQFLKKSVDVVLASVLLAVFFA